MFDVRFLRVKADQMQAQTGNERGQPLHELKRGEHDVDGAVLIRALQLQYHLAGAVTLDPFMGEWREAN